MERSSLVGPHNGQGGTDVHVKPADPSPASLWHSDGGCQQVPGIWGSAAWCLDIQASYLCDCRQYGLSCPRELSLEWARPEVVSSEPGGWSGC